MAYSTFNPAAKDTHVLIDEYGMAVIKGSPDSERDSAWRTAAGYKAWGDYSLYVAAIHGRAQRGCIRLKDRKYQYHRHPAYVWGNDQSRDHVISLLLLVYFGGKLCCLSKSIDSGKLAIRCSGFLASIPTAISSAGIDSVSVN